MVKMNFRTEIFPLKCAGFIDHSSRMVMIGSCFTDEIGAKLRDGLFDVSINPFGTLYNPESIASEIEAALDGRSFTAADLFNEGIFFRTFRRHSDFSSTDPHAMLATLNETLADTRRRLADADLLIITFGSAIAFRHIESGSIVANCHKQPGNIFTREFLTSEAIASRWQKLIDRLRDLNPSLRVIFTVSPVRHNGYGLALDRLSKSVLTLACAHLTASEPQLFGAQSPLIGHCIYFPSYEIMVDDLRDYRFYREDMAHPSDLAVRYIYDIFCRSFMNTETIAYAAEWERLTRRLHHRFADTDAKTEFINQTLTLASALASRAPYDTESILFDRFRSLI